MRYVIRGLIVALSLFGGLSASADEFRPGYLELRQSNTETYDVFWKVPAQGESLRLGIYVHLPKDAINLSEPRGTFFAGAYSERWRITRPGGLVGEQIRIAGLPASVTDVLVRVVRDDGTTQVARLSPSNPAFVVEASAGPGEVAWTYLLLGVEHILLGIDHLLFVLGLLLIVTGFRRVVATITAFTVAHSITLVLATLGWLRLPSAPVEAVIALSIVFVAAEIVHAAAGKPGLTARRPWVVAFVFGLLHGLGFAGVLSEIGLPQNAIPVALLFFNLGVEVGQLLFVAAFALVALLLSRVKFPWLDRLHLAPAYAIGSVAMFWVIQRVVVVLGGNS